MEASEAWAYRARQTDQLVQVRVIRIGTQKPARVLVHFVDDVFEGREEWVPPARLKVLWENVGAFREREARWDRIKEAGLDEDDPRVEAAEQLFELLFDNEEVSVWYRRGGALRVSEPAGLAAGLGLTAEQLTGHRLSFTEDDALVVPWEVTELVARAAARQNAPQILQIVASEERAAQREAIHGRWSGGNRSSRYYFEPEQCIELDAEHYRPRRKVLRSWCGAEAVERFDELLELRKEIRRVAEIAQAAIGKLRAAGLQAEASRLERDLGTPVAMLRPDPS